ncbi:hypothetical protein OSB04_017258 [Centaurea solstitialis]|uniref:Retrotransposon Copia-like N-terminal domain-containing protein n=1 Tax=Centaurea solstitialis TaxID=347529 RepID=A0AA38T2K2_9ASTR|nr:hypothetical protein OSB04_017258 [Centaurea solstitialis]
MDSKPIVLGGVAKGPDRPAAYPMASRSSAADEQGSKPSSPINSPNSSPPSSPKTNMADTHDDNSSLIINSSIKDLTVLSSSNYLGWKIQIEALLHGLDLHKFIDGSLPAPTPTVEADKTVTPHKDYAQ